MRLENKNILVIGSTGGIGSAACEKFYDEGANLILFSRNEEKLSSQKEKYGDRARVVSGNALSEEDIQSAVELGTREFGQIDVLLHAVGSIVLKPTMNLTPQMFRDALELNLVSPFLAIKSVLKGMIGKGGSIVVVSSVAGSKGLNNHEAISAAKGGLEAMIRSTAITYAKKNVRINGVALGLVDTPLASFLTGNKLSLKASESMHPMGRIGKPHDVTGALTYLASDESKWTTGTIIPIDGGMAAG